MTRANANVSAVAPATSVIGARDPQLAWLINTLYPAAVQFKAANGRTPGYADLPEPPKELTPMKKNQLTGKVSPYTDSQDKPMAAARVIFDRVASRYRPAPKNKHSNQTIFGKILTLKTKINAASGITRGRGAGVLAFDDAEVDAIADAVADVENL